MIGAREELGGFDDGGLYLDGVDALDVGIRVERPHRHSGPQSDGQDRLGLARVQEARQEAD